MSIVHVKDIRIIKHLKDVAQGKTDIKHPRSDKWPELEREVISEVKACELCGGTTHLNVHHILPFHLFPEKELVKSNLIILCESKKHGINCHLWGGHWGNFKQYNPKVVVDISEWKKEREDAIKRLQK